MFKRILYKIVHPLMRFYWFLVHPKTSGVKCLIEHDGKFLVIRNTYGEMHWTLPGGGIKKGESPEQAVLREVKEEVRI
ncbi:MAG: NUDIX domain-containing protein, partial [Patescibacteria group bacterium]